MIRTSPPTSTARITAATRSGNSSPGKATTRNSSGPIPAITAPFHIRSIHPSPCSHLPSLRRPPMLGQNTARDGGPRSGEAASPVRVGSGGHPPAPRPAAETWQAVGVTRPLLLVDSASLYFRAYFGIPESAVSAPDGSPVNAVRGFLD